MYSEINSQSITAASCEGPLMHSGPVLPQSFDLTDMVLLGRLLALPQLTLPRYSFYSLVYPLKKPCHA